MSKLDYINKAIKGFYKDNDSFAPNLVESILYSVDAGGKRIRPLLFLEVLEAFGMTLEPSHFQVAAALEMIHTGSLIHDDLPAMDNDDYRRGLLTNHKKFDEATAILAADSLFLDPFGLIAETALSSDVKVALIQLLSYASGTFGMVGGQALDMAGENKALDLDQLQAIHQHKTGDLLAFPFKAAAVVADTSKEVYAYLSEAGALIGHAFQVRDDILDVTADFETIGKTPNKDVMAHKSTYPSILGLEASYQILNQAIDRTIEIFDLISKDTPFKSATLVELVEGLRLHG